MLIRLDPRSDKPIYRQISDAVATSIEDGTVDPGERLPSARSLGDALDVNMHTVLRAYSQLEEWGLAEMRRGRGGVVVSSGANLKGMAKRLVGQARRQRLELGELTRLVEEAWN
jgi:DNA-binding transcriptional regulator YhcF (GntR family)